ncbi:MAG: hypothetical protein H6642_17495 [Caldilineaceae bacterium]|nr:hypothetical protein [Caldilineaceae bacterium]
MQWFDTVKAGGLVLPDGWFGRPYDNLHRLSFIQKRPHKLLLELDQQLLLVFTALNRVEIENSELILTNFSQCVFDWQEYGNLKPHVAVYQTGTIKLVPPPGMTISWLFGISGG